MKKTPNYKAILAKFLDELANKAAQSPEDVPNVYRDLCIDLLMSLGPEKMKQAVLTLAKTYNQTMPDIKIPGWETDEEIPF